MSWIDNLIKNNLPENKLQSKDSNKSDLLNIKSLMYLLSISYLALTFWLFLSDSSLNILLLYAIFTYVLYTPLIGIFSKPQQFKKFVENDGYQQFDYLIHISIFMLLVAFLLIFTKLIHPASLLMIAQSFIDGIPNFKLDEFLTSIFKGWPWYGYIVFALTVVVAWYIYLMILVVILVIWLLSFLLSFFINLLGFVLFIALILLFLYQTWKIAYRGYKNSREYIHGDFKTALYIISTIVTGVYVSILLFANLVVMH
jgi:hypothetical protein